jgi:hypothetical protein
MWREDIPDLLGLAVEAGSQTLSSSRGRMLFGSSLRAFF